MNKNTSMVSLIVEDKPKYSCRIRDVAPGLTFPFLIKNDTDESVILTEFQIEFNDMSEENKYYRSTVNDSNFYYKTYYLQPGECVKKKAQIEIEPEDISNEILVKICFVECRSQRFITYCYAFKNSKWNLIETMNLPAYKVYVPEDISEYLVNKVEIDTGCDGYEAIKLSNFSVEYHGDSRVFGSTTSIHGEITCDFINKITVTLKVILYDKENKIIHQTITQANTLQGYNTFRFDLGWIKKILLARVEKISIIIESMKYENTGLAL